MSTHLLTPRQAVSRLKKRAATLAPRPKSEFAKLAEVLSELQGVAPREFRQVAKEIGVSPRTAFYLARIWGSIENLKERDRLLKLGWTKLSLVAPHLTAKNSREILTFAETHTTQACRLHLSEKPIRETTRCMLLRFGAKDYARFADAIVKNGGKKRGKGLVGTEKALMKIVATATSKTRDPR